LYSHMLFDRSSEKTPETEAVTPVEKFQVEECTVSSNEDKTVPTAVDNSQEQDIPQNNLRHISQHPKRKRGAQPGHKGHGRKIPEDLPVIRVFLNVPKEQRSCSICGKEHKKLPFTENSSQIDVKLELFRVEYVRERVKRTCDCSDSGNRFVTAPQPRARRYKRRRDFT